MEKVNTEAVLQKIKSVSNDSFSMAEKYYSIIAAVNNIKLTKRELQLVAFTAVRGNISYANAKQEFCERYGSTGPSINNIVSKLKRMKLLVRDGIKVKVNPVILLPFEKDVMLEIKLIHG